MKRFAYCTLLSVLILSMLLLSGCSALMPQKQPQIVNTYPKETAPSQVIKAGEQWVLLRSTYGGQNYTISVGEDSNPTNNIFLFSLPFATVSVDIKNISEASKSPAFCVSYSSKTNAKSLILPFNLSSLEENIFISLKVILLDFNCPIVLKISSA